MFDEEFDNSSFIKISDNYENLKKSYLGFFILRDTKVLTLGRSYIKPRALKSSVKGYCLLTKFKVNIKGKEFDVDAFPWMSQDGNVSRCAHIAIWSIVRYYSEHFHFYPFKTLYQIANLPITNTRKSPSVGLTIDQISQILLNCNFYPGVYIKQLIDEDTITIDSFKNLISDKEKIKRLITLLEEKEFILNGYVTSKINFHITSLDLEEASEFKILEQKILNILVNSIKKQNLFNLIVLTIIESGIPLIVALKNHAITIIGHGLLENFDEFNNFEGILDSYFLINHLIVSDDNFLPYKKLFRDKFCKQDDNNFINDLFAAIVPYYEKMFLDILFIYTKILPVIERFILGIENSEFCFIRRVLMTSSNSFKKFVAKNSEDEIYKEFITSSCMPKFIWIAEYGKIEDFKNKKIEYRIVIDASSMNYDPDVYINIKVSDSIIINKINVEINEKKKYKLLNKFESLYINNLREL